MSKYCAGIQCGRCGEPATAKIKEVVFDDDANDRVPKSNYLCSTCFDQVFDPSSVLLKKDEYAALEEKARQQYMDFMLGVLTGNWKRD